MNEIVEEILHKFNPVKRDSLIPVLQEIQDTIGYLNEEAIVLVGNHLGIPTSKIYGVATFYNQFRFESRGKYHIQVCHGTACHMIGALSIIEYLEKNLKIKAGQKTRDGLFSLEVVTCIGACAQAPVVVINGVYHRDITLGKLKSLIDDYHEKD